MLYFKYKEATLWMMTNKKLIGAKRPFWDKAASNWKVK